MKALAGVVSPHKCNRYVWLATVTLVDRGERNVILLREEGHLAIAGFWTQKLTHWKPYYRSYLFKSKDLYIVSQLAFRQTSPNSMLLCIIQPKPISVSASLKHSRHAIIPAVWLQAPLMSEIILKFLFKLIKVNLNSIFWVMQVVLPPHSSRVPGSIWSISIQNMHVLSILAWYPLGSLDSSKLPKTWLFYIAARYVGWGKFVYVYVCAWRSVMDWSPRHYLMPSCPGAVYPVCLYAVTED